MTEAEHLSDTSWFDAPMDAGAHAHGCRDLSPAAHRILDWTVGQVQGSGTPVGHGGAHHHDGADEAPHADAGADGIGSRVPAHFTADATVAMDLLRDPNRRPRLTVRLDVTNVANSLFVIARESEFSPGQHSAPRQWSLGAQLRF